ncbi:MAG: hypothetical protein Tsb005_19930 [Gammaproteobacteria bacterium]
MASETLTETTQPVPSNEQNKPVAKPKTLTQATNELNAALNDYSSAFRPVTQETKQGDNTATTIVPDHWFAGKLVSNYAELPADHSDITRANNILNQLNTSYAEIVKQEQKNNPNQQQPSNIPQVTPVLGKIGTTNAPLFEPLASNSKEPELLEFDSFWKKIQYHFFKKVKAGNIPEATQSTVKFAKNVGEINTSTEYLKRSPFTWPIYRGLSALSEKVNKNVITSPEKRLREAQAEQIKEQQLALSRLADIPLRASAANLAEKYFMQGFDILDPKNAQLPTDKNVFRVDKDHPDADRSAFNQLVRAYINAHPPADAQAAADPKFFAQKQQEVYGLLRQYAQDMAEGKFDKENPDPKHESHPAAQLRNALFGSEALNETDAQAQAALLKILHEPNISAQQKEANRIETALEQNNAYQLAAFNKAFFEGQDILSMANLDKTSQALLDEINDKGLDKAKFIEATADLRALKGIATPDFASLAAEDVNAQQDEVILKTLPHIQELAKASVEQKEHLMQNLENVHKQERDEAVNTVIERQRLEERLRSNINWQILNGRNNNQINEILEKHQLFDKNTQGFATSNTLTNEQLQRAVDEFAAISGQTVGNLSGLTVSATTNNGVTTVTFGSKKQMGFASIFGINKGEIQNAALLLVKSHDADYINIKGYDLATRKSIAIHLAKNAKPDLQINDADNQFDEAFKLQIRRLQEENKARLETAKTEAQELKEKTFSEDKSTKNEPPSIKLN